MKKHFEKSMLKLLKEKCVDQITISELIQEVGSCKGTFYKYYVDKYDLCNKSLANHVYSKINFDAEDWEKFLINYIDVMDSHAKVMLNAFASGDVNSPLCHSQWAVSGVISRVLQKHDVNVEDGRMEFIVTNCGAFVIQVIHDWMKNGRKRNKQELVEGIRDIMPRSIYDYVYKK